MIDVIAHLKTNPGKGAEVVSNAAPLIEGTRRDCIFYDLDQTAGDPDTPVFVERWEAHFAEPHIWPCRGCSLRQGRGSLNALSLD